MEDDKQRYSFNDDKTKIKANQGHSVKVTFNWEQVGDRIVDETNN